MMLNTHTQYARKIKHMQLGLILNIFLSLLRAGLPSKVNYANSFSQALGIEKVFVRTDLRPQAKLMRANIAASYDRS
jgi:hypothetical protein